MATFFDGFEQFGNNDRPDQLLRLAGYTLNGAVTVAGGRKGGGSSLTTYRSNFQRAWTFSGNAMSIGFAVKMDARGPLIAIRKGTTAMLVWSDPETGLVNIGTSLATGIPGYVNPLKDRWYYFEIEMTKNDSAFKLYVNGRLDQTYPLNGNINGDLIIEYNPYTLFEGSDFGSDTGTRIFDDIYLSDSARIQPIQVTTRFPTADSEPLDWSFTGAASHWQAVGQLPPDMLDKFIYTAKDGATDQFTSAAALPDTNPIRYLQMMALFRKATSDPMDLIFNIDDQKVTQSNIPKDWTFRYMPFNASGYTAGNIGAAKFGAQLDL